MKLIKRGKVYHIRYTNEKGVLTSVSTHCNNAVDAEAYQTKWTIEGKPNNSYLKNVNDVLDYYYINVANTTSVRRMNIAINHLKKYFKDIKWKDFNNSLAQQYQLQRPVKSSTIRYELNQMRTAQNYCVDDNKLLPQNKKKIKLPKAGEGDDYIFTNEDIDLLFQRFKKPHITLFMEIALNTSARKKHILELMWLENIDFVRRLIYFNKLKNWGTTKKGGIVKMNDRLYNVLSEAHKLSKTPYVISYAGNKVKHLSAMQVFKKETLEPKFMTKTFRHTASTWAAEAGISMKEIGTMTGHTEARTTERYIHLTPDYQNNMVNAIEDKLRLGKTRAKHFLSIDKSKKVIKKQQKNSE